MAKIEPTVGCVVWYRPASDEDGPHGQHKGDQPLAAHVAAVNDDGTINLMVIEQSGTPFGRTAVPLVQEGDNIPPGAYAEWMPYQKGQAAKTEELERKAAETT